MCNYALGNEQATEKKVKIQTRSTFIHVLEIEIIQYCVQKNNSTRYKNIGKKKKEKQTRIKNQESINLTKM